MVPSKILERCGNGRVGSPGELMDAECLYLMEPWTILFAYFGRQAHHALHTAV